MNDSTFYVKTKTQVEERLRATLCKQKEIYTSK